MGAGRAIVSTPYAYASELLADGRGVLVAPGSPSALAEALDHLLSDRERRDVMGRRAHEYSRRMVWSAVGREHERVLDRAARGDGGVRPRARMVAAARTVAASA
jgi:glycosyltransferase involved in cell wall biosynthesis